MQSILEYLFGAASFMPHGYCLLWRPDLVAMHATSDFLIAASYFSIPIALGSFVTRRTDIQFSWVFWLFAAFIAACGLTHLAALLTLWWPAYGAQGLVKVATAAVSVVTAFMLWPLIPKALALPSPDQLRRSNDSLSKALAEKESVLSELQSLLDAAPVTMLLLDREGMITRISSRAAAIFEYEVTELIGANVRVLLPGWDHESATRSRDGRGLTVEVAARAKDGRLFPAEIVASAYTADGDLGQCLTIRDISRERQAEAARLQSEAIKSGVLDAALDAVVTIDHQGIVVDWNNSAEELFGYTRARAIGADMASLIVPPAFHEAHRKGLANVVAGGTGSVLGRIIEMPARRADGSEFPVDLYIVGIPSEGKPMFTGFARDISDRKLRERELRDEKARLANLVEAAVTAIITIDNRGLIGNVNPATEKLFGYTEAELVGRNVHMLMPEPYHSQHDGYLRNYLGTGHKKIIGIGREVMGRRKDGSTFPIHLAVSEFEASGQRYFTGIIHDLSDRKNAEEALRESEWRLAQVQKMEAVGQLSGGVAHDFNNLLTVIGGNLELYMAQLPESVDQRLLNDAKDAVDMGARLTERLLTFSRQRSLAPVQFNLNELVLGMSELLRRTLGEAIDLSASLASGLWPLRADVSGIENTVLNLAINARDAMPKGGRLIIETRNHSIGEGESEKLAGGEYVHLSVSDSGTGMSPEIVARAFEPFFSTKEPGKGTGLGLASVYGFVRQSGGHAEIYSEIGTGTTVNIYLPRDKGGLEFSAMDRPQPTAKPAVVRTILVVEDNPLVRRLTVRRVEDLGYRVLEADSGPDALKMLRSHGAVDLIFSDVVMAGGMSGLELARSIREERPGQKILLTTGFAEEIVRGDSMDLLLRILRKPYDQARLSQAILDVMSE